ncbi:MAG: hypothetical protein EBS05_26110, partial [Proteobacteria bacterium]|nr:hypothetical protein [Pseudomonadota bacterium]
ELVRPAAQPAPPASFFTPAQPTVDPLADQIAMLKQRAAQAQPEPQPQPQFVQPVPEPAPQPTYQPVAPAVAVQPVAPEAAPAQPAANEEKPGFWSRVGGFFIRSKKDPQSQAVQPATQPQAKTAVQWPPNNIVVRDPKVAQVQAQVPAGLVPGGMQATNFPRVQYAPVTNQGNMFLPRVTGAQPVVPGMPQPPAPPREVREMRPSKTNPQGLTDLQGNAPIELILGKTKAVLHVYATGPGRVSPDLNGADLDVGQTYTIEAQPGRGAVFVGWTGSIVTNSPILRFTMRTGTLLTANFQFSAAMDQEAPELALQTPPDGARLASAAFVVQGQARDNVAVARVEVSLNDGPWEPAQGTDNWSYQNFARPGANYVRVRAVDQAGNQSPQLVRSFYYSVPSTLTVRVNSPAGDAFGEIVVDAAGRVKLSGELPDGTSVRHEAFLGRNGIFPLHVPLAGGRGMLLGWVTVSQDPNLDAFGEIIWHKPLTPQDRYYPGGFSSRRLLFGNLYTPTGTATSSGRSIEGMLRGGNLDKIVLGHGGVPLTPGSANFDTLARFTWNFRPDTGYVDGTFIHPLTHQETAFRGALLQKRGWTSGYFLGQNSSGVVHLQLPQ